MFARKRSIWAAARLRDGDLMRVDGQGGVLEVLVDAAELADRLPAAAPATGVQGCGRELFGFMRAAFSSANRVPVCSPPGWRCCDEVGAGR